jgi:hypothetical protein
MSGLLQLMAIGLRMSRGEMREDMDLCEQLQQFSISTAVTAEITPWEDGL